MPKKKFNFCPLCGNKLPRLHVNKANFCCYCGNKLERKRLIKACIVCHKQIINEKSIIIKCSFCGSISHSSCVSSWLLKYNACPMCQNVFLFPEIK